MKNNHISTSGAIVFRGENGKKLFLVTKNSAEEGWEIPKVTVRKGESSVRAAIRMTTEQAGMNARILEEAHRVNTTAIVGGRSVTQRIYYYLMLLKAVTEIYGFADHKWVELAKAKSMVGLKREKEALGLAKETIKQWEKAKKAKKLAE